MSIFQHKGEVGKFVLDISRAVITFILFSSNTPPLRFLQKIFLNIQLSFYYPCLSFSLYFSSFFIVFLFPCFLCPPLSFTITPSSSASCGDGQRKKQGNGISCVFSNHRSEVNLAWIFLSLKIQILFLSFSQNKRQKV